jgi:hypothetical protein
MSYKIKRKYRTWETQMMKTGKVENPLGWKKVNESIYTHKLGNTEVFEETKGKHKGLWRVRMSFPEYHKELTSRGFSSKSAAINFAKGYLIIFPYG